MLNAANGSEDKASLIIDGRISLLQIPRAEDKEPRPLEAINSHILAYYYSGLTNLFCQACLPCARQASTDVVAPILEASHADFQMLDSWLEACDPTEIQASPYSSLYQQVREQWKEQVRDAAKLSQDQSHY